MSTSPVDKEYIGVATTTTPSAPGTAGSYTWSLIKGDQGIPGETGADGQTSYLHIKYSDNGTTFTANNGETPGAYIGTYVDFTEADSLTFGDYTWNLVKGDDAAIISLVATAQVLTVPATGGATTPTTAVITAELVNTTITAWTYSVNGGTFSTTAPTGVSRTGNTVTITGGTMTAKTIAVKATDGTISDTITIAKVSDGAAGADGDDGPPGADAYTVLLTNESHTFPGDVSNALAGSATSTVIAYKGTAAIAATVGAITGQVTGLTTAITNNSTTAPLITVTVTTALVTKSGKLTIPITVDGKTFTKEFSWSVAYKGTTGATGTAAKVVTLTATTQVLSVPSGGGATTPATSVVTGTAQGTTISVWQYSVDGGAFSSTVPTGVSRAGNVVTITGGTMTAKTIAVLMGDGTVSDTLTIAKVSDGAAGADGDDGPPGADAYTVLLTNESHTFPGSISAALAGSTTSTVIAYKGTAAIAATVGAITGQVTGLTTSIASNGTTAPVITITVTTSLVTQSGKLTVPITVDGKLFTKEISWSVARTGATGSSGTNARAVSLSTNTQAFTYTSAGTTPSPAGPVTITATALNTSGTVYYEFVKDGVTAQNITSNTYSYTPQASFDNMPDALVVNIREGASSGTVLAKDTLTLFGVKPGIDGTDGEDGRGIVSAAVTYQNDTDGTTAPTGTWTTSPSPVQGQYLWTRTITTYTDSSTVTTYSVSYNATDGQIGEDGNGIASTSITYQIGSSGTTAPTGTWTTTVPAPVQGQYLWTKTVITYTNASTSTAYNTSYYATDGTDGEDGLPGADAYTVFLTNEAHTFTADTSGSVSDYGGGVSTLNVYYGNTKLTCPGTTTTLPTADNTYKVTATANTAGTITLAPDTTTVAGQYTVTPSGMTTDFASRTFTIVARVNGVNTTFTKVLSYSKSKTGTTGAAGADALAMVVTSSAGTVFANGTSPALTLTAKVYVGGVDTALTTIRWYKDGVLTGTTGATQSVSAGAITSKNVYTAKLENPLGTVKAQDEITLALVTAVDYTKRFYRLAATTPAAPTTTPASTPSGWTTTEPTYTPGSTDNLYFVDATMYTDGTWDYTPVSASISFAAAKAAYVKASDTSDDLITLPKIYHGNTTDHPLWNTVPGTFAAPVGSTWFQHQTNISGSVIAQYTKTGTGDSDWAITDITSEVIANLDVGKLTAGTGTMIEATIEKLWTDVIRSRQITTDMLLVGSGLNLVPNGALDQRTGAGALSNAGFTAWTADADKPEGAQGSFLSTTATTKTSDTFFELEPDTEYKLSAYVKGTLTASFYVKAYNNANTALTDPVFTYTTPDPDTTNRTVTMTASWVKHEWTFTTPATTTKGRIAVTHAAATQRIGNIRLQKKYGASLIVDGGIAARHLNVDDIRSSTATIGMVSAQMLDVEHVDSVTGQRMTLTPDGLRLWGIDDGGEPSISLTTSSAQTLSILDSNDIKIAGMDADGNVIGKKLVANEQLTIGGTDILEQIRKLPQGVVAASSQFPATISNVNSEYGLTEMAFIVPEEFNSVRRLYRIEAQVVNSFTEKLQYNCRYTTNGTAPTISSSSMGVRYLPATNYYPSPNSPYSTFNPVWYWDFDVAAGTMIRMLLTVTGTGSNFGWISTMNPRFVCTDEGLFEGFGGQVSAGGGTLPGGSATPPPSTTPTQTYTKSWAATAFQIYASDTQYSGSSSSYPIQGYNSATAGGNPMRTHIYFPYSTIQSALAGATINSVELYLLNVHTWYNAGGTAAIAMHNYASPQATFGTSTAVVNEHFAKGEGKWVWLSGAVGTGFQNGTVKGISLNPGITYNLEYYGYYGWAYGTPTLRIKYTK